MTKVGCSRGQGGLLWTATSYMLFVCTMIGLAMHSSLVAGEFRIVSLVPDKLLYDSGDTVKIEVAVENGTAARQDGEIVVRIEWEMDEGLEVGKERISLNAGENKTFEFEWESKQVLGAGAYADLLQDGKMISSKSDFFNVVDPDDMLRVCIHTGEGAGSRLENSKSMERYNYCNLVEITGWGGTPTASNPPFDSYSGHYGYISKEEMRRLCANPVGKRVVMYWICWTFKSDGEREYLRNPKRFTASARGFASTEFDMLSNDLQGRFPRYPEANYYGQFSLSPDYMDQKALDWVIDGMIASAKDFGWRGVRFDGQPQLLYPDSLEYFRWDGVRYMPDEIKKRNMEIIPYLKKRLKEKDPSFAIYFNCEPALGEEPPELKEMVSGGCVAGSEVTRHSTHDSNPYNRWSEMYRIFATSADSCARYGGYYSAIMTPPWEGMNLPGYKMGLAMAWATGTQPWFSNTKDPGVAEAGIAYNKMGTRYSAIFWGHGISRVPDPEKWIGVETPTGGELWWKRTVSTRKSFGNKELLIMTFVNKPPSEKNMGAKQVAPKPVENARVVFRLPDGAKIAKAWNIGVFPDTSCNLLNVAEKGGTFSLDLPKIDYFGMIVAEIKR